MRAVDLIAKKRDGEALSAAEIEWFVREYTADRLPDYQAAALCMAIYWRGMSADETVAFTLAVAASGEQLDLHDVLPFAVDKHSSGGVGDKTSLVVLPLVAACGVPVAKMSGRGLGFSGGTLDKMEAITGWSSEMDIAQFKRQVAEMGLVLAGQTAELAPADGKLYALRDVTATVPSIPLIACSIMSKKLAAGADGIVLDVKMGSGAFMKTLLQARTLAETMVQIGRDAGRQTVALLSDMNQPLGYAVGNALEVAEAVATLRGTADVPLDFWAHCLDIAAEMLLLAGRGGDLAGAKKLVAEARDNGRGLAKFREMVAAQGGDVRQIDEPSRLPQARLKRPLLASRGGYVEAIDTRAIGLAAMHLGAGRAKKGDVIDMGVGLRMPIKIGTKLAAGEPIATIFANDEGKLAVAEEAVLAALTWSDEPVAAQAHLHGRVA